MISLDEALERVLALAGPVGTQKASLKEAMGRYLAAPVTARTSQPPFDASAMDGYALRAGDIEGKGVLEMIGESRAGAGFGGELGRGQCVRIFTGAPVPVGADAVVMQEKTHVAGRRIAIEDRPKRGQNIRPRGQDFTEGDTLIKPGALLTPAAIALAAAANTAEMKVFRKPALALLATGDELVEPGASLFADQIIASNTIALSALFAPYVRETRDLGISGDSEIELRDRLGEALDKRPDVLVTTGGASVGDHDLVQPVLKSLGVEIDFWKIAMRPGKPLMFGKKGNTLVFGLPGNPVSAMVTASVVVLPALRSLSGSTEPLGPRLRLPLAAALPANGPRRHFMRARVAALGSGISAVRPIAETDSAHLSSFAAANALIVQPENAAKQAPGEIVDVIPLWVG